MLGRYAMRNLFIQQTLPVLHFNIRYMCNSKEKVNVQYKYDQKILKIINNNQADLSVRYNIPEAVINAFKLHREEHGLFTSLEDVLQVEGMTKTILNQFLHVYVKNERLKLKQRYKENIFIPSARNFNYEENSTILSIHIGTNVITWTLLETSGSILQWNYESFLNISEKDNTINLLELAQHINSKLPKCDVYIVNELTVDKRNIKSIKYTTMFLWKQQLKAMLLGIFANKNLLSETEDNKQVINVYIAQQMKIAVLFDLLIGNEIISSKEVVNKILFKNSKSDDTKESVSLQISDELKNIYQNESDFIQEQMNWSLLTALVFLQFGIFKKYDCEFV